MEDSLNEQLWNDMHYIYLHVRLLRMAPKYLSEEVIGHLNHLLTFGVWIPLGLQVVNPF